MADYTITFQLTGDVTLDVFAEEMRHWSALINGLSVYGEKRAKIVWYVEKLEAGSATAVVRGESEDMAGVQETRRDYLTVARRLEAGEPILFPRNISDSALALRRPVAVGNSDTALRLAAGEDEVLIFKQADENSTFRRRSTATTAYGSIEGRIQTLSSRRGLEFTLFDTLFDKAVTCRLREGEEHLVADKWNRLALVYGLISRNPVTGKPVSIRDISNIVPLPERNGEYRQARAILPFTLDDETEDTLGRLRDAW